MVTSAYRCRRGVRSASIRAHRILIVTSAYHTRRALAIFRRRLPHMSGASRQRPTKRPTARSGGAAGPGPKPGWERRPGGSWWTGGAMGRSACNS
jgi:uncharacterized SAM-binding protein YcdF (DUF218 family)